MSPFVLSPDELQSESAQWHVARPESLLRDDPDVAVAGHVQAGGVQEDLVRVFSTGKRDEGFNSLLFVACSII